MCDWKTEQLQFLGKYLSPWDIEAKADERMCPMCSKTASGSKQHAAVMFVLAGMWPVAPEATDSQIVWVFNDSTLIEPTVNRSVGISNRSRLKRSGGSHFCHVVPS